MLGLLELTLKDLGTALLRVDDYGISGGRSLTHIMGCDGVAGRAKPRRLIRGEYNAVGQLTDCPNQVLAAGPPQGDQTIVDPGGDPALMTIGSTQVSKPSRHAELLSK